MRFFDAAYAAGTRPVRLREADPELLTGISSRHPVADRELPLVRLPAGPWIRNGDGDCPALGFLVLDGLLAERVAVGSVRRSELLGAGDIVRPWDAEQDVASLDCEVAWDVIEPAQLAVLDDAFVRASATAPDVLAAVAVRAVQRSHRLAQQLAVAEARHIEDRLIALFRLLGDRWGRMTGRGMHLPIRLTHELIAELIGAKRPTVTTALGGLERAGALERRPDRTWLVRGSAELRGRPARTMSPLRRAGQEGGSS